MWGATTRTRLKKVILSDFNPRPPCGGRHCPAGDGGRLYRISIHAPRVGGDSKNRQIMQLFLQKTNDFYKHYSEVIPNNEVAVHFTKNDSKNLVRSYRAFLFA